MDCKYEYLLTEKAESDLDEVLSYLAGKLSNPQAAKRFLENIEAAIHEARCFPDSGVPVENDLLLYDGIRKKLVGNYALYYLPHHEEKKIYILRVIYAKRNPEDILRQLYS